MADNKITKVTPKITSSTMSNLVGMWAMIFDKENPNTLLYTVFIDGKADEKYFIVRVINQMNGEPNIAFLVTIEQIKDWVICPDLHTVNSERDRYSKDRENIHQEAKKVITGN